MKSIRALAAAAACSLAPRPRTRRCSTCPRPPARNSSTAGRTASIIIWSWLYGYYSDQDADPVVDFGKLTSQGQRLVEYCAKNPTTDIITAAEPIYDK